MKEFVSPNFANNKFHTEYNNRLQPVEIWAGSSATSNLFDKRYSYDAPAATHQNNGNIYTVTNVNDSSRSQTYTYDVLNRLSYAGDQAHWANSYTYDAWGNMRKNPVGSVPGERLEAASDYGNHVAGYGYDQAGNMRSDGTNNYAYDAEYRILCMNPDPTTWSCNQNSLSYTYDADGRRVKKSTGTNYWYGPTGQPLAETDASGNWTFYIFFAGQRLARNVPQPSPNPADIKYYITDHLHSTAMFVDKAGTTAAVLDDNDFYPWGGAVPGVGKTTSNNTVKFTGHYRDSESQLDYMGARYYANVMGRFMSPDWAAKPTSVPYAEFGDPQSLNLYSYVRNHPITQFDPDGHTLQGWTSSGDPWSPSAVASVGGDGGSAAGDDPFKVTWVRADISTTITYNDGNSDTFVHPGDVALSGSGTWSNQRGGQDQKQDGASNPSTGSGNGQGQTPKPNVQQEVNNIHSAFDHKVADMTKKHQRMGNGTLGGSTNNALSSLQRLGELLHLTDHHLMGCVEQAQAVSDSLNVSMKNTSYTFSMKQSLAHSWVEGRSSVDGAPVLTLDPWKNSFEVH